MRKWFDAYLSHFHDSLKPCAIRKSKIGAKHFSAKRFSKLVLRFGVSSPGFLYQLESYDFSELASDTEIDNYRSIEIHEKLGFTITKKVICFLKTLT